MHNDQSGRVFDREVLGSRTIKDLSQIIYEVAYTSIDGVRLTL